MSVIPDIYEELYSLQSTFKIIPFTPLNIPKGEIELRVEKWLA